MPKVLTVLQAQVPESGHAQLLSAYRGAARDSFPPGLMQTMLVRDARDPTLWRIETLWESRQALEAMRGKGTPRGVLIFRAAGAEPALSVFDVLDEISPPQGGA